jgi:hypothetical protein
LLWAGKRSDAGYWILDAGIIIEFLSTSIQKPESSISLEIATEFDKKFDLNFCDLDEKTHSNKRQKTPAETDDEVIIEPIMLR